MQLPYIDLIEMVRETNIKNLPSVFQSCMDSLPNGSREKYQWLNAKRQSDRANCIDSLEGNLKLVRQLCTCTDIDFELGENFGFIHIDGATDLKIHILYLFIYIIYIYFFIKIQMASHQ